MTENHWNREEILDSIAHVRDNVATAAAASGRAVADINIMAVTKTVPTEYVNLACSSGISLFGENRAQELCEKYPSYDFDSESIHFIGRLQTNKVRQIVDKVSCIESVDSLHLASEISRRCTDIGKTMRIMLEVSIAGEASKGGIAPCDLPYLVEQVSVLPSIWVCGLMTIPPISEKNDETRRYFDQMHKLFVDIKHKKIDNITMDYLSMGMSSDYSLAIGSGANLVRIGSAIFGKRNYMTSQQ